MSQEMSDHEANREADAGSQPQLKVAMCPNKLFFSIFLLFFCCSCSSSGGSVDAGSDAGDADETPDGDVDEEETIYYEPRHIVASVDLPAPREWVLHRGIIHAHSVYSHDACDDEPFIDGVRNEPCFDDLREGMCATRQDYVFLTDHSDSFAEHEFPDVLLYDVGDTLIERGGVPVANRVDCGDGHEVMVMAGSETGTMPIGLDRHVADTVEERQLAYDDVSVDGVRALQEAGALVFLQHTEGWDVETILELPIDGIEIYNLHQNLMDNIGMAANLLIDLADDPRRVPDVELGLIALFLESEADLYRWSKAVDVRRTPGILATDVHRNVFSGSSPDGERLDSYRRLMHWFSNTLLIPDGPVDDRILEEAIQRGRMYGSFDFLGYPEGFDFHGRAEGTVYEMGDVTPPGESLELQLVLPSVAELDAEARQPTIHGRILRSDDGEWEEIASGEEDLTVTVEEGVYRAEVRIVPHHLRPSLGMFAEDYLVEMIWVYSNPIYVALGEGYDSGE